MKKIWLVGRNEFIAVVLRRSFMLSLILLPLTSFIILLIVSGIQKRAGMDSFDLLEKLFAPSKETSLEGYVDRSGLVSQIPPGYADRLMPFSNEASARRALAAGEITSFYIISQDYIEEGEVVYIRPDFNPLGGLEQARSIEDLLAYALTGGREDLAKRVQDPLNVTTISLSAAPQRDQENPLTFLLPYIVTFLFYTVILTSSSLLLNSISTEKQNRMMEMLMTSITPTQMLTGKITALGLVGLLQTVIWSGSGYLMLQFSGRQFALGDAFKLPPSILLWGVLFFLLGYAVYASLMAGVGALVPNLREGSQLTTIVILPMVVPLMLISVLIQTPDSPLSLALSLFPLTSPVSMMTRLAATTVPLWQTALAVLLLVGSAIFLVQAAARLFRAQNLLSGTSVNALSFLKALIGK
ncbi:MAG: ABC transporter permease [Chloroflexi bacterium]|nr:ABC transporter permease [Chloroflexota bacterium]